MTQYFFLMMSKLLDNRHDFNSINIIDFIVNSSFQTHVYLLKREICKKCNPLGHHQRINFGTRAKSSPKIRRVGSKWRSIFGEELNWIDARDAKSWMMMMLCSLIPIGPYFGSGDLSCSRISSLIQIEAKHIKHSNEHSIVPYMSVKGWEGLYWWEEKYLSKIAPASVDFVHCEGLWGIEVMRGMVMYG